MTDDTDKFVIATIHPVTGKTMFMVDREKCKVRYWSYYLNDVYVYTARGAAQHRASQYRYNNPHVLSMTEAKRICELQRTRDYDKREIENA